MKKKIEEKEKKVEVRFSTNKSATREYEIIKRYEAGISFTGVEAKSVQLSQISIKEAYISIEKNTVLLKQAHISFVSSKDLFSNSDETRERQLLLHKNEIKDIRKAINEKGLTCIPLRVYRINQGKIKIEIAIARGKKLHDKRNDLKNKTQDMDAKRAMKNY